MNVSIEDAARACVRDRVRSGAEIYWFPHPTEIRLVEVSADVPERGEVLPFRFAAEPPDVPYELVVILLHPADWARREELTGWPWPGVFRLGCRSIQMKGA